MSESANASDFLIDAVVEEHPNDALRNRVALEERKKAVEEGRTECRPLQVDSDDDFVVAPEIAA